jgi:hypothetical protein
MTVKLSLFSHNTTGIVGGLVAVAGAFAVTAMVSAAIAPTAHADDLTDIITTVDAEFTGGQADIGDAFTSFGGGDVQDGLSSLFSGLDDELLSVPNSILTGSVEALTNESITGPLGFAVFAPTSFSDAVSDVPADITEAESLFSEASTFLSGGDYGDAVFDSLLGSDYASAIPAEQLLMGAIDSLGF